MAAIATLLLSFIWLFSAPTGIAAENRIAMDIVLVYDHGETNEFDVHKSALYEFASSLWLTESNSRLSVIPFSDEPKLLLNWTTSPDEVQNLVEKMNRLYPNRVTGFMHKSLKVARALMETSARKDVLKVTIVLTLTLPNIRIWQLEDSLAVADALALGQLGYFIYVYFSLDDKSIIPPIILHFPDVVTPRHRVSGARTSEDRVAPVTSVLATQIPELLLKSVCEDGKKQRVCRYSDEYHGACVAVFHYETQYFDSCFRHYYTKGRPKRCKLEECETECDGRWPWELSCVDVRRRKGPNPTPKLLENCPSIKPCPNAPLPTLPTKLNKPKPRPKSVQQEIDERLQALLTQKPNPKARQDESKFYIYLIIGLLGVTLVVMVALMGGVFCRNKFNGEDELSVMERRRRYQHDRTSRSWSIGRLNIRDQSRRKPQRRNHREERSMRQQSRLPDRSGSDRNRDRGGGTVRGSSSSSSDGSRDRSDRRCRNDRRCHSRDPNRVCDRGRDQWPQSRSGSGNRRR